ncbi:MAG: glutamine--fructose-6-phosphate transaminase (isomerizing) [bacterium]|nr:glutamine--fructose-6-phosphate transaminase (isomerizing) [bacterium]MDZ4295977.1 glutamine--fructose-6-phosphate transaminase (isomerizing) [Patescibacteria group bacterium]
MCGIFGYIGGRNAVALGVAALEQLEYRGYDAAGAAFGTGSEITLARATGRVEALKTKIGMPLPEGQRGIFHTRWATHGANTERNAHPHQDCTGCYYIVHNGIIENHATLRRRLIALGHRFRSETDSEVLAHLVEEYDDGDFPGAVRRALCDVEGVYGVVVLSRKDAGALVAARRKSPIIIGIGEQERFVASDADALRGYARSIVRLQDGEIALVRKDEHEVLTIDGRRSLARAQTLSSQAVSDDRRGYPWFMLKEIFEQPEALMRLGTGRLLSHEGVIRFVELEPIARQLAEAREVLLLGEGTAYYAALVGQHYLETVAGIPTRVEEAGEFANREPMLYPGTLAVAISQSGETIETLLAIEKARALGATTLGIINKEETAIPQEVGATIYLYAGRERAVASTKAFTAQLGALLMLAVYLGRQRQLGEDLARRIVSGLARLPEYVRAALATDDAVRALAGRWQRTRDFCYMGRGMNAAIAFEGALKLIEVAYVNVQATSASQMKHGRIALITPQFPTLAVAPKDSVHKKMLSSIHEVITKGGEVVAVLSDGDEEGMQIVSAQNRIVIPATPEFLTPFVAVIPLQLFSVYMAMLRGCDVDHPRNLAKSVTVE